MMQATVGTNEETEGGKGGDPEESNPHRDFESEVDRSIQGPLEDSEQG